MKDEPIALHFEFVPDECCSLCNPVRLADYEQDCVRVHRHDCPQGGFYVCLPCIDMLSRGARGTSSVFELPREISHLLHDLMRRASGVDPDETIH